ncbi:unnamed protein product [Bursaphelenchus xylophilus]|uniref:(pine wood nematode) hypothetical protein n=1 Tax=Bursaphelenchus xylophilus TaxID=6326 RepID=A0A1I7SU60_BURXY|nr:unnamed protein product [Bursaphelenchus xylophilus]CAG9107537.1 unnamed protein product [Bursaphelenchus xylophilus]
MKSIGKCLELYIRKAKDHAILMEKERAEFENGKRHLANIMGWPPEMKIGQEEVDRAVEYLFPSGLTCERARPVMKPPEDIMVKFNKFSFDDEGRPSDHLFFTLRPRFYGLLSDIGLKTQRLNNYHDERLLKGLPLSEDKGELNLTGSMWLLKDDLAKKLSERLSDDMYAQLLLAFENLASLPLAHLEKGFIMEYRTGLSGGSKPELFGPGVPAVKLDAENNIRFAVGIGKVKSTRVTAKVSDAGTGLYTVNDLPLSGFQALVSRENFIAPLIITGRLGKVDVAVKIEEGPGGISAVPRAARHALSLGLAALYPNTKNMLRLAGLLTQDPRRKERNKVNQPGARAKWIWKRR